jgi:hypothetical protein
VDRHHQHPLRGRRTGTSGACGRYPCPATEASHTPQAQHEQSEPEPQPAPGPEPGPEAGPEPMPRPEPKSESDP